MLTALKLRNIPRVVKVFKSYENLRNLEKFSVKYSEETKFFAFDEAEVFCQTRFGVSNSVSYFKYHSFIGIFTNFTALEH